MIWYLSRQPHLASPWSRDSDYLFPKYRTTCRSQTARSSPKATIFLFPFLGTPTPSAATWEPVNLLENLLHCPSNFSQILPSWLLYSAGSKPLSPRSQAPVPPRSNTNENRRVPCLSLFLPGCEQFEAGIMSVHCVSRSRWRFFG